MKMIPVSTGSSFVYIIISKFGHVGIYDDKLRLQRKYEIDIDTDPDSDLDVGASDPGWVTDAIWMENSKHIIYTSSLRSVNFKFFVVTTLVFRTNKKTEIVTFFFRNIFYCYITIIFLKKLFILYIKISSSENHF